MRAWFETEDAALAYCADACDDEIQVAWLDGSTIVLATIRVVRDEAGDALQPIVYGRSHASPSRIAAAADHLARVCRAQADTRAAVDALEDALRGGAQQRAQSGDD